MSQQNAKRFEQIDINCDMGEHENVSEAGLNARLMSYISSCNIACGGHAGSEDVMRYCLGLARQQGVAAGAHPSYPDKNHFGRRSLDLTSAELKSSLHRQLTAIANIGKQEAVTLEHVKPHGALYHDVADDLALAKLFVAEVAELDQNLKIIGCGHSALSEAALLYGLEFKAEAFIDRRYQSENRLVPRSQAGAVITNMEEKLGQAKSLIIKGGVYDQAGQWLPLDFETLCIHGDHTDALATARAIDQLLRDHIMSKESQ